MTVKSVPVEILSVEERAGEYRFLIEVTQ